MTGFMFKASHRCDPLDVEPSGSQVCGKKKVHFTLLKLLEGL